MTDGHRLHAGYLTVETNFVLFFSVRQYRPRLLLYLRYTKAALKKIANYYAWFKGVDGNNTKFELQALKSSSASFTNLKSKIA